MLGALPERPAVDGGAVDPFVVHRADHGAFGDVDDLVRDSGPVDRGVAVKYQRRAAGTWSSSRTARPRLAVRSGGSVRLVHHHQVPGGQTEVAAAVADLRERPDAPTAEPEAAPGPGGYPVDAWRAMAARGHDLARQQLTVRREPGCSLRRLCLATSPSSCSPAAATPWPATREPSAGSDGPQVSGGGLWVRACLGVRPAGDGPVVRLGSDGRPAAAHPGAVFG